MHNIRALKWKYKKNKREALMEEVMLLENTMFGRVDKVKTAIDRLKMFEPEE